MQIGAVVLKT